jgi:Protein of unknown function (DUF2911)
MMIPSPRSVFALAALVFASALPLTAQMPAAPATPAAGIPASRPRISPHETISQTFDGNRARVTITYGRPYSKDPKSGEIRKVWGGKLVPYGKTWRTGSDEATILITQEPLEIGGATIPAGAYSLYTLVTETSAKLIINQKIGQWGISGREKDGADIASRDEKFDVAQVDLKSEPLDPQVDQFTMALVKGPAGGGVLILGWEKIKYSVAFTVKK